MTATTPRERATPSSTSSTSSEYSFLVKTHERPNVCRRLLRSIRDTGHTAPILVADDSREPTRYADVAPDITDIPVEPDCGLSAGRNALVDACQTDLCVLLDDDFVIRPDTRLDLLLGVVREGAADIAGGCLAINGRPYHFEGWLDWRPDEGVLYTSSKRDAAEVGYCDVVFNFFAARTAVLADGRWPDWLKLGEHNEFFLRCQGWGPGTEERADNTQGPQKALVAYVPQCVADHVPFRSPAYDALRYPKASEYRRRWYEWRGIRKITGVGQEMVA